MNPFHVERETPVLLKRVFQGKCLIWNGRYSSFMGGKTPLDHNRSLGCSCTGVSSILDHNGMKDNRVSSEYNTVLSKSTFASSPLEKRFYVSVEW